jgi:P63C domain
LDKIKRKAGKIGGARRAEILAPERRTEIAREAAQSRWGSKPPRATHGSEDHPLIIGDVEIPCFVLENDVRVLTQGGFTGALGMARGGSMIAGMNRLQLFVSRKGINSFISSELVGRIANPIPFVSPTGARAHGFEATLLADVCEAVLKAREAGVLQAQQLGIAAKCEILVRGFARVGIIALVDEATGFQRDRARDALAKILEEFVAKELQPWVKTFPNEYYSQLFRLRGLDYPTDSVKRPKYFGTLTNDIVYKRLAPGVLDELKKVIPKTESGRRKGTLSQGLTRNIGYPKLREHLGATVAFMKLSRDYHDFIDKMDTHYPRYGDQYRFDFDYEREKDDGKGI